MRSREEGEKEGEGGGRGADLAKLEFDRDSCLDGLLKAAAAHGLFFFLFPSFFGFFFIYSLWLVTA